MRNFEIIEKLEQLKSELIKNNDYEEITLAALNNKIDELESIYIVKVGINYTKNEEVKKFIKNNLEKVAERVCFLGMLNSDVSISIIASYIFDYIEKYNDIKDIAGIYDYFKAKRMIVKL